MKYCSTCKQNVQPISSHHTWIFCFFLIALPIIFFMLMGIVGIFLGIVPPILYRYLSKKVCPMCNSS
jgi:hypothetical protein